MPLAERGQAGVLDLVDDHRNPMLGQPVVERTRTVALHLVLGGDARRAGLRYVTVAVGRDYADVAPTSGTYEGPYEGVLTTSKRAAVTNVEYLRPRRRRRVGPLPTA